MLKFPKGLRSPISYLRYVKKDVPAFNLKNSIGFKLQALQAGSKHQPVSHVEIGLADIALSAVHGRHDGRVEGRDAQPPQHGLQRRPIHLLAG